MSLSTTNKFSKSENTKNHNSVVNMSSDDNADDAKNDMLSAPSTPDHLEGQYLPTPISSFTPHQFNDLPLPSPFPDFGIYSPSHGYSNGSISRYALHTSIKFEMTNELHPLMNELHLFSRDWNPSKLITDPLIQSPPLSSSSYFLQTASPTAPSDFPHFPTRFPSNHNNEKRSHSNK